MGDIVEMIQEGILCECCGEYIGKPVGHSRECRGCRRAGEGIVDDDFDMEDNDEE